MKKNPFYVDKYPLVKEYPSHVRIIREFFGKVHYKFINSSTKRANMYGQTFTMELEKFNSLYSPIVL